MIEAVNAVAAIRPLLINQTPSTPELASGLSFEQLLRQGLDSTDNSIAKANQMVTAFVLDNDVPAHQVMFALEQARLSMELMVQVRNRLVEGYQQIMNMQV